jgi:hypothetical protein
VPEDDAEARYPPPGWYPANTAPGFMRWWDGNVWSDQVRAADANATHRRPRGFVAVWWLLAGTTVGAGFAGLSMLGEVVGGPSGFGGDNTPSPANLRAEQLTYHAGLVAVALFVAMIVLAIAVGKAHRIRLPAAAGIAAAQAAALIVMAVAQSASTAR